MNCRFTYLFHYSILAFFVFLTQTSKSQQFDSNWEKLQQESQGGLAEDIAYVNGKLFITHYNELFTSTDDGANWTYVLTTGPLGVAYGGSPNGDSYGADRKLIVSGDTILFGNQFSSNGGATWTTWSINASTLPTSYYFHPTVMHLRGTKLYLGTLIQGMYVSNDLGKTFVSMNTGYPAESHGYYYQTPMSIEFYNGQPVVATLSGLYKWNGTTWSHPAGNGLPTTIINPETTYPLTSYLIDRIRFIGSTWLVSTNFGVYYSNDQGVNWQRFTQIPQLNIPGSWSGYSSPAVFYNLDVADGKIIVSFESDIYISADGGANWKHSSPPEKVDTRRTTSFSGNFVVATSGGMYHSTDGTTWQKRSNGFERATFYVYERNGAGFIGTSSGILKSSARGKTLTPFNNGIDFLRYVWVNAMSSDEVVATRVKYYAYAGTSRGWEYQPYRSNMGTDQWSEFPTLPVEQISKMEIGPDGTYLVTGPVAMPAAKQDWTGIHLSTDKGQTWKKIFTNVTNNTKYEDHVSTMLYDSDTIYAGTYYSGVYKSSDKGYSWTSISAGINLVDLTSNSWWDDTTAIDQIWQIKRFKNHLYVIGDNTFSGFSCLYHSSDGGKHWVKKDFSSGGPGYASAMIGSLSITETGDLVAKVARNYFTDYSLLISHDNGNTWQPCGPTFPDGQRIDATGVLGDFVYASGKTGLWRLKLPRGLTVYAADKTGDKGTQVVVPIKADKFNNLLSSQFTVEWNPSVATFVGVEQFGILTIDNSSFGASHSANGKLTFSWSSPNVMPEHLPDSSVLFAVRFNLNGNYGDTTNVRVIDDPVAIEFADANFQLVSVLTIPSVLKINSSAVVHGKVVYDNDEPVNNVALTLVENSTQTFQTTSTNDQGDYTFTVSLHAADNTHTLTPSKLIDPDPLNGIDVRDIAAMRRHIVQTETLSSPYQVIAADVNQSQHVTTLDIVLEQALILGVIDKFPGASQWAFVDAATVFPKPESPFPYSTSTTVKTSQPESLHVNFKAIKLGDVDASRDNSQQGRISEQDDVIFVLGNEKKISNDIIEIPLQVKRFDNISGYQFTISWDTDQLEYIKSINITNIRFGEHRMKEGLLTAIWDDENGKSQTLQDGAELFKLQFRKRSDLASNEHVNITGTATNALVYNSKLNLVPHLVEHAVPDINPGTFQLYQNFPNAFIEKTSIGFSVPKDGNVQIDIIDAKGSLIRRMTEYFDRGTHVIEWDGTDNSGILVESGLYIYKATYGKITASMKMVKN